MLYTQFRENERTARFEVRLVPGNRCLLSEGLTEDAGSSTAKTRAKKAAAEAWSLGQRDEATWVDLEAELRRIRHRAPIDFGLRTGEEAGAGRELIIRLDKILGDLYRNESEDYLTYLGLLNIFEYFRLVHHLKHFDRETTGAKQLGLVSDDFFACRKLALERDLAELTEWLVAHGVGIPDLSIFYPEQYPSEEVATTEAAPKKRGKKKAAEGAETDGEAEVLPQGMPVVVKHLAELVRLQQANTADLVHFVDDVMQRMQLATPREALEKMRELLPWIDLDYLERQYNSLKVEQARETERQQLAIQRQREIFEKRPRRGLKGGRPDRPVRGQRPQPFERSPLDEFVSSIDEDPEAAYEQAMQQALESNGDSEAMQSAEAAGDENIDLAAQSALPEDVGDEGGEEDEDGQAEIFGHPEDRGAGGGYHDDRRMNDHGGRRRKRRSRHGRTPAGAPPPPQRPQGGPRGPREERAPREDRPQRRERPQRSGGGGQPNFDEIQPFSNYSPGLTPPPNSSAAMLAGGPGAGKKKWRGRRK